MILVLAAVLPVVFKHFSNEVPYRSGKSPRVAVGTLGVISLVAALLAKLLF
jgi:hypothetical protein